MKKILILEKILMLEKTEYRRRRKQEWLDGTTDSNGEEFEQTLGDTAGQRRAWCTAVHEVTKSLKYLVTEEQHTILRSVSV